MPTTRETIRAFYAHIERKEFEALRGLLHDDLYFQGPVEHFESADYLVAQTGMLLCLNRDQRIAYVLGSVFSLTDTVAAEILGIPTPT